MADNTISLFKLRNKLDAFKLDRFTYSLTDNNSLKLIKTPDPKYVDPIFSMGRKTKCTMAVRWNECVNA